VTVDSPLSAAQVASTQLAPQEGSHFKKRQRLPTTSGKLGSA